MKLAPVKKAAKPEDKMSDKQRDFIISSLGRYYSRKIKNLDVSPREQALRRKLEQAEKVVKLLESEIEAVSKSRVLRRTEMKNNKNQIIERAQKAAWFASKEDALKTYEASVKVLETLVEPVELDYGER